MRETVPPTHERHKRRTPISAHGEPAVWVTAGALVLCLALILGLLVVIVWRGGSTFVVRPIQEVTLDDGTVFLGLPLESEDARDDADGGERRRYRVGNRDLGQNSFRWVNDADVASVEAPEDAAMVERREWGVFLGRIERVLIVRNMRYGPDDRRVADGERVTTDFGPATVVEVEAEGLEDGGARVREQLVLGAGQPDAREVFERVHPIVLERRAAIERLNSHRVPMLQERLARLEWKRRGIERRVTTEDDGPALPAWAWTVTLLATAVTGVGALRIWRMVPRGGAARGLRALGAAAGVAFAVGLLGVVTEHPWSGDSISPDRAAALIADIDERSAELSSELGRVLDEINTRRDRLERVRVEIVEPTGGRFSPLSVSEPDAPMAVAGVVRVVHANELGVLGKLRVYLARWWEFLSERPRANGAEGGVLPVIMGTVTLTLLLTIAVVPLGVVSALYLREYARQGLVTSLIRIAINNLAGVPSIVYGMFGLGFFCYGLGGWVDAGPVDASPRGFWWGMIGLTAVIVLGGVVSVMFAARRPGRRATVVNRVAGAAAWVFWLSAAGLAVFLIANTPYFDGWFTEKLPERPTFGGRGILWASLTLALLTLPVVIVATEEAISAVPNSIREGSIASGASRWQTIRRVVLPGALPGIMTGAILAMARGAGEVAPLMLVGAVNFTQASPVSLDAPFLHGDRTFMHLGFHIYNLGFQSPDSQATEPLVWTTTLLLVAIVVSLNLAAVSIRAKLRGKHGAAI
ncbi:MAG: ABC transporter permease subunit [Phycisphaerales bacterium]